MRRQLAPILLAACLALPLQAQNGNGREDLAAKSLPLRTALHQDPTLAAPLERLLAMYRAAGRVDELVSMYRTHLAAYPADQKALTVLVRLLVATGSPEVAGAARSAVAAHPENPFLRYLLYGILRSDQNPAALDELDRAVEIETIPIRKRDWTQELVAAAVNEDRRELAEKNLRALAQLAPHSPEALLNAARIMQKYAFHQLALETLASAAKAQPSPELGVEIELAAASAEVGLGRSDDAAARLDRLASRLTADYWRRPEILRRRIALVQSEAEREALIQSARKRAEAAPLDEAAALDLAQLLGGFDRRRSALEALVSAAERMPHSARLEKEVLELFDFLRDEHGREDFLAGRIKAQPDRKDLVLLHAKSLFLLGRGTEAEGEVEALLADLEPGERARQLIEVARFLRRSNLPSSAVPLFEKVLAADPARLDIRRELAETLQVLGYRRRARELFAERIPEDVQLENLLDMVQFMVKEEYLPEARRTLLPRLERHPENLDIRMLLLSIEGRLGAEQRGRELILQSRRLADTPARYRLWLESAAAFHEAFDGADGFLEEEMARLDQEPAEWTPNRLERRLAYAEVASKGALKAQVLSMLQNDLDGEAPPEARARLRRRLLAVLEEDPAQAAALKDQLQALAQDDPDSVHECSARLALLHAKENRHDLAVPLLDGIDVDSIRDASLLGDLERLYAQFSRQDKVLRVLERITALDPTDRANWERWIAVLAASGNETRFRTAIRRLLAGVERMPLADETKVLLKAHLLDSYWRSIAEHVAGAQAANLPEMLVLIDSAQRIAGGRQDWLWLAWTRAFVLNRLGRSAERDEAVAELLRVASLPAEPATEEAAPDAGRIYFPDGLSVSLEHARRMLTSTPEDKPAAAIEQPRGPMPPFRVKWAFGTRGFNVTSVVPSGKGVLITDSSGTLSFLDTTTGKLVWEREGSTAAVTAPPPYSSSRYSYDPRGQRPSRPLVVGKDRFVVPSYGSIECFSLEDGRLLWRADVGPRSRPGTQTAPADAAVFEYGGRLVAFDPGSNVVAAFDIATGKLLSEVELWPAEPQEVPAANSGAALCGKRLFVYGAKAAVLNAESGEVEWAFDPAPVRAFPVSLDEPQADAGTVVPATPAPSAMVSAGRRAVVRSGGGGMIFSSWAPPPLFAATPRPDVRYVSHLDSGFASSPQQGTALVAPAVAWAALAHSRQARLGLLERDRVLLFDQSSLLTLPLGLPLAGRRTGFSGTFVGVSGQTLCILQPAMLLFIDLRSGTTRGCPLAEISGGNNAARLQAAIDGPLVYVTGPRGITCVNARSGLRVFCCPWPDVAAPAESSLASAQIYYGLHGLFVSSGGGQSNCLPMADCVGDGVLYATARPDLLVALVEADQDGR